MYGGAITGLGGSGGSGVQGFRVPAFPADLIGALQPFLAKGGGGGGVGLGWVLNPKSYSLQVYTRLP